MKSPINRKISILTFGAGATHFHDAVTRLTKQANRFPNIDRILGYTEKDLTDDFWLSHKNLISTNQMGFGLWIWKPYLIHKEFCKLNDGDILIYMDSGCELNIQGLARFNEYISITEKFGCLFFELSWPNHEWTKLSLIQQFPQHFYRTQISATCFFLKKTKKAMDFILDWHNLSTYNNYSNLFDPPSSEPQLNTFKAHRHDQSCLSMMVYEHDMYSIKDETYFEKWHLAREYPILAMRNKTGIDRCERIFKPKIFHRLFKKKLA